MKKAKRIKRTSNNIAGVAGFTEGELAVLKSMMKNDVKTSVDNEKTTQKTIGAKKQNNHHRRMS